MTISDTIKKLVSYVVPGRISKGYGISTDDQAVLPSMPSLDQLEEPHIKTGALYRVRTDIGRFEMVGFAGAGEGIKFQLKHVLTGETFNVTKKMMGLLFERDKPHE